MLGVGLVDEGWDGGGVMVTVRWEGKSDGVGGLVGIVVVVVVVLCFALCVSILLCEIRYI